MRLIDERGGETLIYRDTSWFDAIDTALALVTCPAQRFQCSREEAQQLDADALASGATVAAANPGATPSRTYRNFNIVVQE